MPYVRHRNRMVAKSVYEDAKALLIQTNWMGDTPLALLGGGVVSFVDYFPEDEENQVRLEPNTLAMDLGSPGDPYEWEMGGMLAQDYEFLFAMNAASDAVAMALFQDLSDRYHGMTLAPFITLYNYAPSTPVEVVRMEVDTFQFTKSSQEVGPGVHLWVAQLVLRDYLEQTRV